MKKTTILLFVFEFVLICSYAQNKKEQIEVLNFSLDSLKKTLFVTNIAYSDSLKTERLQVIKQKQVIDNQLSELEKLNLQLESLKEKLNATKLEASDLKRELEAIRKSQQLMLPFEGNYNCKDENYWIELDISLSENKKYNFDIYIQNNPENGGNAFNHQGIFEKIYLKEDSTICEYWLSDDCLLQITIHEDECLVNLSEPFYIYPVKLENCVLQKSK